MKNKDNTENNEDKKEEKNTFLNDEESMEEQKLEEVEEMDEDESMEESIKSRDSISQIEEDEKIEDNENIINPNEIVNNDDNPEEEKKEEEEKHGNMDLDDSLNFNNNAFYLDFEKALKETRFEMNKGDFLSELNSENNIYNQSINIDKFCLNKGSGFNINRQNSFTYLPI